MAARVMPGGCPILDAEQQRNWERLSPLYGKSGVGRAVDGFGNLLVSGGAFGRSDADKLSKIVSVLLAQNHFLNGGQGYAGINNRDLTEARRLIALYNKPEGAKFVDGIGNFFFGGAFGRSDALDLVNIIPHIQATNELLAAQADKNREVAARLDRLESVAARVPKINRRAREV